MRYIQIFGQSRTLVMCMLAISVFINVALAIKVKALRSRATPIKIGQKLEPIIVTDAKGTLNTLRFDEVNLRTLIYVLRPKCSWCERNEANLKSLIKQAPGRYRLILLTLDEVGVEDYRKERKIDVPVYNVSVQTLIAYGLGGTPETLLVSSDGTLLRDWVGAYLPDQQQQIQDTLGISPLPGLDDSNRQNR